MISIIIPTLNEGGSLPRLLPQIDSIAKRSPGHYELVVVDDGSTDDTIPYLEGTQAWAFTKKVVKRSERGLATAVIRGFREASGEYICVMDADLSHPPALIPDLVAALKNDADIVVASRYVSDGGVEEWPLHRYLSSYISTLFARPVARGVKDPLSGFFAFKKDIVAHVQFNPIGYKILLEILVKTRPKSIREVPYVFRNRDVGESKLSTKIALQYFKHLFLLYRHFFSSSKV